MTLSSKLHDVILALKCPHCGHPSNKKGSWIKVVREYTCSECYRRVQVGYEAKLALFHANAHLG